MSKFFFVFPFFLLASCTLGGPISYDKTPQSQTIQQDTFVPSPTTASGGKLEFSQTGNVDLSKVFTENFHYLDSEKKSFTSGSLSELLKWYTGAVVYFYPKDGTPNCTIQALDFSLMLADFRAKGYEVIGVSKDNMDAHKSFADRNELKIKLLEDGSGELLRAFGSEWPLQTYGNGDALSDIIRSTYVIDASGNPMYAFRDVTAKGHARRIYELVTGESYTK